MRKFTPKKIKDSSAYAEIKKKPHKTETAIRKITQKRRGII